nr:MAG TPA: hypothetical protein [Caudoviricetes sp.]
MDRLTKRLRTGEVLMTSEYEEKYTEQEWISVLQDRLAAYEDTGLTPERCAEFARADAEGRYIVMRDAEQEGVARLRELAEADKDGRLVVLPCKPDGSMLNTSDPERPEIMKRIHFAVAYVCGGIVFHQPYNIFLENIAAGYIRPLNEAEKALEAMSDE